jgi:hypothetical protein
VRLSAPSVEAGTQELNVLVACGVGAISGFFGLKVLFCAYGLVAKHCAAIDAVVGRVVSMHSAVKSMFSRYLVIT